MGRGEFRRRARLPNRSQGVWPRPAPNPNNPSHAQPHRNQERRLICRPSRGAQIRAILVLHVQSLIWPHLTRAGPTRKTPASRQATTGGQAETSKSWQRNLGVALHAISNASARIRKQDEKTRRSFRIDWLGPFVGMRRPISDGAAIMGVSFVAVRKRDHRCTTTKS